MSQAGTAGSSGGGSGLIQTIDGNTGYVTGTTVTFTTGASNANGTALFTGNAGHTTMTLSASDANQNTGWGHLSLSSLTDGGYNTCYGYQSGKAISGGDYNCLYGVDAGLSIVLGEYNVCLGPFSGENIGGGSNNICIGQSTGNDIASTSYNTLIGDQCLINASSPSYNIAIGSNSGNNYTGSESSNILLSSVGVLGESNVIRIGTQGSSAREQNLCFIAGITGATPTSGNTPQVVLCDNTGNLTAISSGSSGYILTSNGTSTPSFQAAPAGGIVTLDGNSGSATGSTVTVEVDTATSSSAVFTGSGSTLKLGFINADNSLYIGGDVPGTGAGNVILGASIGGNFTNSAQYNTIAGYQAMNSATSSEGNCGYGLNALVFLGTGNYNCAIGNVGTTGSGQNYNGSESSNLLIMNEGVNGESNVMRIGTSGSGNGQVSTAYIAGIYGVSPSSPQMVIVNSSGQLGSQAIPGGITPIFNALLSTNPTDTTGDGTVYQIVCDTVTNQVGTAYSGGTGLFTAPKNGNYQFNIGIEFIGILVGHTECEVLWQLNGSNTGLSLFNPYLSGSSGDYATTYSFIAYLTTGQTVQPAFLVSGSTKVIELIGTNNQTTFSGFFLG